MDEVEIDENYILRIDQPKLPEKLVPIVEKDEVRALLGITDPRHAKNRRQHFYMTRDHAAFCFFIDTSARRSGFATCQLDDLDLAEGMIKVVEKGDKERYASLGRRLIKALRAYLALREKLNPWTDNLWVDQHREPMNTDWIYRMMKRRGAQVGIDNLHPHRFRHTSITSMIEDDVSQTTLEKMVGVIKITKTYLNKIGWKQVRVAHRKFSPLDKIAR